ncbi:response regulator transcription factor [Bacteroides caecigallinarum]|uniref:LytR/AlgR family response regulator transcription factor n=1 Tax=Bacteroides TaxID=816 RepID=UPI000823405D|nr:MULTISPECIES: LytTR family DNA-binding domain-containing protein [Bacteroides]MBM6891195.1 response regulator transcription factor [Bacteroides caecigallinarum]MCF2592787.1 response regulator transcription factor [Bacteroides caecigallinarum]MCF2737096.1 response regulator transcription factor [Bacteroides caecigallinarum]MCU6770529.1 LytTR family DNA-binding domain-containing protein [Bacteroides cellulolyticus]MDN0053315.1 LytTR family DNA-binding domain-containing protein [Bacteroides ca
MKKYRAIIVEDERLPRLSLIRKLEDYHPDIDIVECCEDYNSALKAILRHRPDILFLDIQLQGSTTLQLLCELKEAMPLPHIIFTTAYNNSEYLLQAIRLAAADYLLKPVEVSELAKAIQRIKERDEHNALPYVPARPDSDKFPFRTLNGTLFIGKKEIVFVRASGNYSNATLTTGEEIILERLGVIETRLGEEHFIRAGRNLLLNRQMIYKVDTRHKSCTLRTPNGKEYSIDLSAGGLESVEKSTKHKMT